MERSSSHSTLAGQGEDPFAPYRERVITLLTAVAVVFVLPFAVWHFLEARALLAGAILGCVLILAVDAVALRRGRAMPIPIGLILVPVALSIGIGTRAQGIIGAFWAYPLVLALHFVLPRRAAGVHSVLLLLYSVALVDHYVGRPFSVRLLVTLGLTIVLLNIFVGVIVDQHGKLLEQALHDPLTGAFNRRQINGCLADAVERKARSGAPSSLIALDIDHFKDINDRFGHAAGDRVLKQIVTLIKRRTRKLDLLFRVGGEEFLLLLPDSTEQAAAAFAEQLRALIEESGMLNELPVSASIGVSELHAGEPVDAWIRHADEALYRAKGAGRNRVERRTPAAG